MAAVAQLKAVLGIETTKYRAGVKQSETETRKFQKTLASVGKSMGLAFSVAGVLMLTAKIKSLVSGLVMAAARVETMTLSFRNLGMSMADATKHVEDLREFAATTPFQLENIAEASRQLYVFSEGLLGNAESLRVFGDMASAVGTDDLADLSFWVGRLYADLASGKSGIERNLTALQRLKAIAPSTVKHLREMSEAGAAGSVIWAEYVKSLDRFEGSMKRASESMEGRISTLKDNVEELKATLGEDFSGPGKGVVTLLTAGVRGMKYGNVEPAVVKELRLIDKLVTIIGKKKAGLSLRAAISSTLFPSPEGQSMEDTLLMPPGTGEGATGDYAAQISKAEDFNEQLRVTMLDGREKIKAELVAKEEEIAKEIMATQNQALRHMLMERASIYKQQYEKELHAIEESETAHYEQREKAVNARMERQKRKGGEGEGASDLHPEIYGRGVRIDHMAAVGGMVGGDRSGVAAADRQFKKLEELVRRNAEMKALDEKRNLLLEDLSDPEGLR